jgi:hypothetical protein
LNVYFIPFNSFPELNKEEVKCSSAFESMAFASNEVQEENAEMFKAFSDLHTTIALAREKLVRWNR